MGKYEFQYQLDDTDRNEINEIDILSYYWKCSNGMLVVKVTGLYILRDETIKA